MCFFVAPFLYGQEKVVGSFFDKISLKTNAFEWLITVPNIGIEYDVLRTDYKKMSVNLTAKYNWNSYHKITPSTAFDLFDIRPEFRYYLRTKDKKISKRWWAMYLGPYLSYGTYTFKLAPKGIHGYAFGTGVSAGYVCPLYEYDRGAIDVEFGFSLGLQGATREVFTYNPEGNYYMKMEDKSKGLHVTPFPVVSELKVAFAWRKQSIRYQVKIDEEKILYQQKEKAALDNYEVKYIMNALPDSLIYDLQPGKDPVLRGAEDFAQKTREAVYRLFDEDLDQLRHEMEGSVQRYKMSLDTTLIDKFDQGLEKKIAKLDKKVIDRGLRLVDDYKKELIKANPGKPMPIDAEWLKKVLPEVRKPEKVYSIDKEYILKKFTKETIPFHLNEDLMYQNKADTLVLRDSAAFGRMVRTRADYLRKQGKEGLRKYLVGALETYKETLDEEAVQKVSNDSIVIETMVNSVDAQIEKKVNSLYNIYMRRSAKAFKLKKRKSAKER